MTVRRIDALQLRERAPDSVLSAILAYQRQQSRNKPITVTFDGRTFKGIEGEPVALTVLAGGQEVLSRSVKFHRPRSALCFRGNCEGCLTRINDQPNRMACMSKAHDGCEMHSQNSFPSASIDLLRITDWFFPKHFDHHHLMVRYGSTINSVMQTFARKMAGLGTLPERPADILPPQDHACDVLVVGLGATGLAIAHACAKAGLSVFAAEEESTVGGTRRDSLQWQTQQSNHHTNIVGAQWADEQLAQLKSVGVKVALDTCISATFDDGTIGIDPQRAHWIRAKIRVFCNGRHESVTAFENNDLPGVYTERAVARALRWGVTLGERVLVCGHSAEHQALADALGHTGITVERLQPDEQLTEALGSSTVTGAMVVDQSSKKARKIHCDAIAIEALRTPAFELAGQAGVEPVVAEQQRCFVPHSDALGRTERRDVFVAGSLTLKPHDPANCLQIAQAIIDQVAHSSIQR